MKFHWFHLMPYPDLPRDLRAQNRSVWVDLPAAKYYDPVKGHAVYHEYLDELEHADQEGFDGICVNEHHQNGYGMMPSPNLMASILARSTKKANIVIMGNSVALYNPPIRIAEEMAMLDVLSGGRIISGFPVGTPMDTTFCYGENPATLREKYREGVDLILRAWASKEPFAFNGKYTQLRYVNIWPRPLQQPRPPIWIPGGGSVETWDWCAKNDFLYAYLSYSGYKAGLATMQGFWEAAERNGIDRNPHRAGFLQFVGVAETDEEAERLYSGPAMYFYNTCLNFNPGFSNPPGYTSVATMRKGIEGQINKAAARTGDVSWKDIIDRGYVVAGSPATVIDRLNEMADQMNVGHVMVLCQYGNMSKETTMYNTTRFARDVIPKLKNRFSDWEDRWSPGTGITGNQVARTGEVIDV